MLRGKAVAYVRERLVDVGGFDGQYDHSGKFDDYLIGEGGLALRLFCETRACYFTWIAGHYLSRENQAGANKPRREGAGHFSCSDEAERELRCHGRFVAMAERQRKPNRADG